MDSSDISIIGFSSVASIVSLLLAENGVEHSYYIKKDERSPLALPPLSNPLVNGPTQLIEKQYIPEEYLSKVKFIKNYNFLYYDNNYVLNSQVAGVYNTPIYAIDTRIRFHCFLNKIKNTKQISLIETDTINIPDLKSSINIVGKNEFFNEFERNKDFPTDNFPNKRIAFFFNLTGNKDLLDKYSEAKMLFIGSIGEITIYPFLHKDGNQALNVTITFNKGQKWDCFNNDMTGKIALNKLISLTESYFPELAMDLSACSLLENDFTLIDITPCFNKSTKQTNKKYYFGVGEVIIKIDPVTGQGYNSGVVIALRLSQLMKHRKDTNNLPLLVNEYEKYADTLTKYLYHINRTFTQGTQNKYLVQFYKMAENSTSLKRHLIAAFDDISLYFPWLIDENATVELIKKHTDE